MVRERNNKRIKKNRRERDNRPDNKRRDNRRSENDRRREVRKRDTQMTPEYDEYRTREQRRTSGKRSKRSSSHVDRKSTLAILITCFILIIVVFMASKVFDFINSTHITPYEVKMGSLAINNTYRGIALREEQTVKAGKSGYINFYTKEGEKVSNGSMVYTIDSTGKLANLLNDNTKGDNSLSKEDLLELKNYIASFSNEFNDKQFYETYDFRDNLESSVLKFANYKILNGIDSIKNANYTDAVAYGNAPVSGVLVYDIDGYETLSAESIDETKFDETQYNAAKFHTGDLISETDDAYKLITSEDWSIVIEIDEEREEQLKNEEYVEVRFLENGYKSWGKITIIHQTDHIYMKLDFNNSMITFATKRFIDIELLINTQEGLKIPKSSIVEKALYIVPEEYYVEGGSQGNLGFIRKCILEDGTYSTEFIEAPVDYKDKDGNCYIEESFFKLGDELVKENSTLTYEIRKQAKLDGVYNINKGYAEFKGITILNENDEYAIVKSNTEYGLSVYDHIALKGDSVGEDDFIY